MSRFTPCLWFDSQAEQAASFYQTVFARTKIGRRAHYSESAAKVSGQKAGSLATLEVQIEDLPFLLLNGGPHFKFTPAISFMVSCASEREADATWAKLADGGTLRMELGKYPWAEKYGWTADRFGVEWQVMLAPQAKAKIVPTLLFVDKLFGKAEEALRFYTAAFPDSRIDSIARDDAQKTIMHSSFTLDGQPFAIMDGAGNHGYSFNEATSLIVECETQAEVDAYWRKLGEGGSEQPCGWLKDRFGVSWQVVPAALAGWMADPAKSDKVFAAILTMKKLDVDTLARAAR